MLILYTNASLQTRAAKYAAGWLSEKIHSKVRIDSLKITGLHTFEFKKLYVQDQAGDTLLLAPSLKIELLDYHNLNLTNNSLFVQDLQLTGGEFYLHKNKRGILNLDFLIDFFSSPSQHTNDTSAFMLRIKNIHLVNSHYRMENEEAEKKLPDSIFNPNDFDIRGINLNAKDFYLRNDSITANVSHLALNEKSGFRLLDLKTLLNIGDHHMTFSKLLIKTPNSTIGDHYEMHYKSITGFDKFESTVTLVARLKNAHVASKDISYFASELKGMNLRADISATGQGKLENLKIRNLIFHTAHDTYINGNLRLRGLPNLETTFMDLDLNKFSTSISDVKDLMKNSGLSSSVKNIPAQLIPLGNVEYKGSFEGFYNDFVTRGTFKTALGNIISDINLKFISGKLPVYRGNINTDNFNLGKLLSEPVLGNISVNANLRGSGFTEFAGKDTIDTQFRFIDFRGYRYHNILVKGSRIRKLFNGDIAVNDPNLGLLFKGSFDLDSALPSYDFKAKIGHADLRKLKFLKDSIEMQTQLEVNAHGSNLTNLQGKILVSQTTLNRNGTSFKFDSLALVALNNNGIRTVSVHSCILDGSVKGKYDLATFPSAVKAIFAQYVPSITGHDIVHSVSQNFEFNLNIFDADPILAIFAWNYYRSR